MKLAPLAGRMLRELEEAGGDEVVTLLNTVRGGVADATSPGEACDALAELQRKHLVRLVLHHDPAAFGDRARHVPTEASAVLVLVRERLGVALDGAFRWDSDTSDPRRVEVVLTGAGRTAVRT